MKTAIYIEDGVLQLVITPETRHEKSAIQIFQDKKFDAKIFAGSFYDCNGGWVRQAPQSPQNYASNDRDQSLILRVNTEDALLT